MRVSKFLGSLLAVGAAVVAITATTESRAGDESLVKVTCSGGSVSAEATGPWHVNDKAPWKWDKGDKVSVVKEDSSHHNGLATFKGKACEGTLTAFVCNGDTCKGPIKVPVK